ncbi:hypothetical protein SAMN05660489_05727 [Pseudomonas sp. LAMO17WK12:I10]|uniref:hypothetical protein n=1 Tax=unclassified Pseudomonas TaxID=196821 RepID=UPI000BCD03B2|nr:MULTISPECIES: hypothetical protein [unclassified Pseudomonas]PXX54690.1 hypothetical protein H160_05722 [Pseudomonas sp. LAMO17WK12:I9]SNY51550.1 hypothetical protein SAMN05660489_05727 [Pseudomonas sp. LAMO17WK12:I10]
MRSAHTRGLFKTAACFNVLAGLPMLLATTPVAALLGLEITPTSTLFIQITMAVVVMFGWAYWMVSVDPVRYRPFIGLGLTLKVVVVALIGGYWLAGNIPWPLPALALGDIVLAVLFWRYLRGSPYAVISRFQ